ncbi:F-box domain-containing protein [Colletotrichum plurivorum]|uniref:F-box domain-containing protein n=1 Tax=Colletotrichum plurivorum TaxID=2175906 RepID=A0A8H6JPE2_9PEZI|nr:F-box domain-containing protein [Colletotrichum plurivorum]
MAPWDGNASDPAFSQLLSMQYLSLPASHPDNQTKRFNGLRRENLKNLVKSLDQGDLLFLRNFCRRSFPDFPLDVRTIISRHLRLRDVLNCARVSRAWRVALTHDEAIKDLLRYHFPGITAPVPSNNALWDFFRTKAMASIVRVEGKYISRLPVSMFDLDCSPFALHPAGFDERLRNGPQDFRYDEFRRRESGKRTRYVYNNGRFAWHIDEYRVFIDDLRAKPMTRTLVSLPNTLVLGGQNTFDICLLTENLLVFLDCHGKRRLLKMPDQTAEGYIRDSNFFFAGVIFHPTDSSVLYVVVFDASPSALPGPDAKIVTSVHKYESRNYTRSFYHTTPVPAEVGCSNFTPRYRRVNYANYNLFLFFPPQDFTDFFVSQVNFNVLTETFSRGTHMLNTGMRRPIWALGKTEGNAHSTEARFRGHAWNDQLYYLQVPFLRPKDSSRSFRFDWRHSRVTSHCIADKDQFTAADWRDIASNYAPVDVSTAIDHIADDHFVIVVRNSSYVAYNYDNRELVGDAWKGRPEDATCDIFCDGNTTCPIRGCITSASGPMTTQR